jgi:hypothetical protein
VVQEEFGADDFRTAMNELLELKQTRTIEEYTTQFKAMQYDITMHQPRYDEMFFAPKYIIGLKEEIRGTVDVTPRVLSCLLMHLLHMSIALS